MSAGLYESLNCGPGSRDAAEAVAENRGLVCAALAPQAALISLSQIHSPIVHTFSAAPSQRPEAAHIRPKTLSKLWFSW